MKDTPIILVFAFAALSGLSSCGIVPENFSLPTSEASRENKTETEYVEAYEPPPHVGVALDNRFGAFHGYARPNYY
jgi:hypothetical protein